MIRRREFVNAEPGFGWAIVGNHQDLPNGHEAGSLAIADSDCMAKCDGQGQVGGEAYRRASAEVGGCQYGVAAERGGAAPPVVLPG